MPKDQGQATLAERNAEDEGGGFAGLLGDLTVAVGALTEQMNGHHARKPVIPWEACHPVAPYGALAGTGTFDSPDLLGPHDPYWWDLRRFAAWGFTAGTVAIYKNNTTGQQLGSLAAVGNITWSTQAWLRPRDRVIIVATGITGAVQWELEANEVKTAWIPEYIL